MNSLSRYELRNLSSENSPHTLLPLTLASVHANLTVRAPHACPACREFLAAPPPSLRVPRALCSPCVDPGWVLALLIIVSLSPDVDGRASVPARLAGDSAKSGQHNGTGHG